MLEVVGTLEGLDAKYKHTGCCRGWPRAFARLYQWGYDVDVVERGNGETNIGAGAYPVRPYTKNPVPVKTGIGGKLEE